MIKTLEQAITSYLAMLAADESKHFDTEDLAQAVREYVREVVEECLKDNDSDTHIIAKDLCDKI